MSPLRFDPEARCGSCGRYGAVDLGDERLCEDCYSVRGSCCLEFGGFDLWRERQD